MTKIVVYFSLESPIYIYNRYHSVHGCLVVAERKLPPKGEKGDSVIKNKLLPKHIGFHLFCA